MADTGDKQGQSDHFRDVTKMIGHRKHYLYHVTTKESAETIMKDGLLRQDNYCIYLSERPESWWRPGLEILRVRIPGLTGDMRTFMPEMDEVLYFGDISPLRISRFQKSKSFYKAYKKGSAPNVVEKDYITKSEIRRALHNEVFEADSKEQRWEHGCWIRYRLIDKILNELPTADVRPVKRGEWIDETYEVASHTGGVAMVHTGRVCCSECDEYEDYRRPFCPNCGADMREES